MAVILFAEGGDNLTNQVIIALVSAVSGGLIGLFGSWWNQKRPNRIEVQHTVSFAFLSIVQRIHPRISVAIDGNPVARFAQVKLAIRNRGPDTIKDIVLTIEFKSADKLLECELSGVDAESKIDGLKLVVAIPYLNPYRQHHETLTAKVVGDGEFRSGVVVTGRGAGWSAFYASAQRKYRNRPSLYAAAGVFIGAATISVIWAVHTHYGAERTAGFTAVALGFFLSLLFAYAISSLSFRRRTRRLF